jgi:hypothetical protein
MEITNCYTFLGSIITRDGYDYKEINGRLSIGRMVMTKQEKIMKVKDIKKDTCNPNLDQIMFFHHCEN